MYATIGDVERKSKPSPVYYKAIYDYQSQGFPELSLKEGDVIEVIIKFFRIFY